MNKIKVFLLVLLTAVPIRAVINCESVESCVNLENVNASLDLAANITDFAGHLKLQNSVAGMITSQTSNTISFVDGQISTLNSTAGITANTISFSGIYDPTSTDKLVLNDGAMLDCVSSGTIYQAIEVGDGTTSTTARITGRPHFAQDILIKNNATLEIAIETNLNRNIRIESTGKLKLLANLSLANGIIITDTTGSANATVVLNNKTLEIGAGTTFPSTGGLIFGEISGEKGSINLRGDIKVVGTWYFTAGGRINGHGNWIDWSGFAGSTTGPMYAKLWSGNVTNLDLNQVKIRFPAGGMLQNDSGETFNIYMREQCKLKLGGSYTLTAPTAINLYSRRENNVLEVGSYTLAFSTNCNLIVEYVPLYYDTLDQPNATNVTGNISYTETPNPVLTAIASIKTDTRVFDAYSPLSYTGTSVSLNQDHYLTAASAITFVNATPATPKAVTFDGNNYALYFPQGGSSLITMQENIQLTIQNMVLENLNPAAINYVTGANPTATIVFGDGVVVKLRQDLKIAFFDPALNFTGNAQIIGHDYKLTLSGENKLTITGSGKTLTLNRVKLFPQGAYTFDNQSANSTINFVNSRIWCGLDGCAIRNGNVTVDGSCRIFGIEKSYFDDGVFIGGTYGSTAAWKTAFRDLNKLKIVRQLGFGEEDGYCSNALGRLDVCDVSAYSANKVIFTIDYNNQIWLCTNGSWTRYDTTADFNVGSIGVDAKVWVVKNNRSVHRLDGVNTLVAAEVNADAITVGDQNQVYILQNDTGRVYKCDNPTAGTPTSWTQVANLNFARAIAAGRDGTLWFIDSLSRVFKRFGNHDYLLHDGTGKDFIALSASGDKDSNFVAVQTTSANGGRVLVSRDNGYLVDLGVPKIGNSAVGITGALAFTLASTVLVDEPGAATRQPIWQRFTGGQDLSLYLDKTFTFSSDANLTINSGSKLQICNDATLFYNGNSSDNEAFAAAKKHLVGADKTATLHLLNGHLNTGNKGLTLEQGNLIVEGLCSLKTSFATNKQFELSSAVQARIRDGATLQLFGKIDYSQPDRVN